MKNGEIEQVAALCASLFLLCTSGCVGQSELGEPEIGQLIVDEPASCVPVNEDETSPEVDRATAVHVDLQFAYVFSEYDEENCHGSWGYLTDCLSRLWIIGEALDGSIAFNDYYVISDSDGSDGPNGIISKTIELESDRLTNGTYNFDIWVENVDGLRSNHLEFGLTFSDCP